MTNDSAGSDQGPRKGGGTTILIILALVVAAGVGFWIYRTKLISARTAEISMEEYLKLNADGSISRVELDGDDLFADMARVFIREGRAYRHVHVIVPPAYLVDPKGFAELHSGLSPSQFIYTPKR